MLAKSPDRKRAVAYLEASGAAAITIIERDKSGGAPTFAITTSKITGTVVARWWIAARDAPRVAKAARQCAGANPNLPAATAALARSAAAVGATLTPDDIAISRASAAVTRLDVMVEQMRRSGQLQEFNSRYKRGRAGALAEGRGFMTYGIAMARLKAALVPHLIGQSAGSMQGLFEQIFR
jgi:hypothetical protein